MLKAERSQEEIAERLRELGQLVRAGKLAPKQVDEERSLDGLPLIHDGWQELNDITTNSVWWLPQTVLFYAWQDLARTREQWERFKVWGRDLWRDAPDDHQVNTFDEAENLLRSDLTAGIVRAFGTDTSGKVRPIPCEVWDGLTFSYGWEFTVFDADGTTAYSGVFVLRHEVVPLLIAETAAPATEPAAEPEMRGRPDAPAPKRGGGRPQRYDWDAMWIEVVRLATEDKITDRPTLSKHLLTWFVEKTGAEPGESIFKEKMGKLFASLGWE